MQRSKIIEAMGKEEENPTFYSHVGERINRWWKNLERYGFDISIAEFEDKKVEKEIPNSDNDESYIGDTFDQCK